MAFLKYLQIFFNTIAVLSLTGIIFVVLFQILARYALPQAPVWTEELSRFLFIFSIVFASGTVIIKGRHVNLELFHHRLSKKRNPHLQYYFQPFTHGIQLCDYTICVEVHSGGQSSDISGHEC